MAIYCSCTLCHSTVSTAQLSKHYGAKTCRSGGKITFVKLSECPHCKTPSSEISDMASHCKWCLQNPRRGLRLDGTKPDGSQLRTPAAIAKMTETMKLLYANNSINITDRGKKAAKTRRDRGNTGHTTETKEKLSAIALSLDYQRKAKRTHEFTDKLGRVFSFDSSWEDALAIRLDELGLRWDRPKPIKWVDSAGKTRRYFADFHLPEYDIYLDPKNPFVVSQQQEKLNIVSNQINLRLLTSLEECKTFSI